MRGPGCAVYSPICKLLAATGVGRRRGALEVDHTLPESGPPPTEVLLGFSRQLADATEPAHVFQALVEAAGALTDAWAVEVHSPSGEGPDSVLARWERAGPLGPLARRSQAFPRRPSFLAGASWSLTLACSGRNFGRLVLAGPTLRHELAAVAAGQAAMALAQLESRRQLRRSLLQTVTALAALVESKDEYTEDHCTRIAELALQVGIRLGLPPDRLDQLTFAAILHDIGKIGVPETLLRKPGPLTEEERQVMRRHPVIGGQVLKQVDFLKRAGEIVEQHHERYDGQGYPRGLSGEKILLEARILAVADAYDAMVTDRPYRKALGQEQAIAELRRAAGSQFDPKVVEVFVDLIKAGV